MFESMRVKSSIARLFGDVDSVRESAVAKLIQLGPHAVEPLVQAIHAPGCWKGHVAAVQVLGKLRAYEPLVRALGIPDWPIQCAAAEALGELGDRRAVEPLIVALRDTQERVVTAVANALGKLGDARATEPLIRALIRQYGDSQKAAATALEQLGEPKWLVMLGDRVGFFKRLGESGDSRALEPLIEASKDFLSCHMTGAADTLATLGGKVAVEPLIEALRAGNWAVAHALGELKDGRAVEPLVELLRAIIKKVAAESHLCGVAHSGIPALTQSLGKFGDTRAVDPLLESLVLLEQKRRKCGYSDDYIKRDVSALMILTIETLGRIGDMRVIKPMGEMLKDEDKRIRAAAAEALGKLGGAGARESLVDALVDCESVVRTTAARALGEMGEGKWTQMVKGDDGDFRRLGESNDPHAAVLLMRLLGHDNIGVRKFAAEALGKLRDDRAIAPLSSTLKYCDATDAEFPRAIAEALVKFGPVVVEPLIEGLGTRNNRTAIAAAEALGKLGDARAVEPLIKRMADRDIREAALKALVTIGPEKATDPLIKMLGDDPGTRSSAAKVLAELGEGKWAEAVKGDTGDFDRLGACGDPRSAAPLIKGLMAPRWDVRKAAGNALVAMAARAPSAFTGKWGEVRSLLTTPHGDAHEDYKTGAQSDCTYVNRHTDEGIGLDAPRDWHNTDF